MSLPTLTPTPMPRTRGLFLVGLVAVALGVTLLLPGRGIAAQAQGPDDLANVTAILDGMKGTAPIPCALALTPLEGNGWNHSPGRAIDADPAAERIQEWLEHPITDPAVVPILRTALGPGDACVRQAAARLLGRTAHPRAASALADALRDPDAATRALGALGLGFSDQAGAYEPLVSALKDAESTVRANAALALGHLGDHRAMPMLVPLLKHDRVPQVREAWVRLSRGLTY